MTSNKLQVTSGEQSYKKLIAWQLADKLAWNVYLLTDKFPKDETYGLTSQLRRAILSVALNIVEGYSRNSRNEFRHFLNISLGSLAESDYLIKFSFKREYINKEEYDNINNTRTETGRVLWSLSKSLH